MNGGVSPFALAQGRLTFAAVLTVGWLLATRPRALVIQARDIVRFTLLGAVGFAAMNGCYLAAISSIPVAAGILLQYLAPTLTALYAWGFMDEKMRPIKLAALALALGGCYLVVGGYNLDLLSLNRWGLMWGLGAAVAFAFYGVYSEYGLRRYSPWTVLCYALITSAAAWNAALGPTRLATLGWDAGSWLLVFYSASLGTVVAFGLFAYGIEQLRATQATIVAMFEPIAAGLIAYLWLGEQLEGLQMAGGLVVASAVILIQREREHDRLAPAALKRGRSPIGEDVTGDSDRRSGPELPGRSSGL
jgi:drug/metabolite transporter (DMT)-like permease